jgi:hypothetical protein
MKTSLRVIAAFVLGLVLTYAIVVAGLFAHAGIDNFVDRDGGMSMGIVFMVGPLAGIVGGVVCAIAVPVWLGRRDLSRAQGLRPPAKRWPLPARIAAAAIGYGLPVYLLGRLALWIVSPLSFRSYWAAFAVGLAPLALGVLTAGLAAFSAWRGGRAKLN